MYGSKIANDVKHSRFMDEFDKFMAKEGESLESMYERLTTLVNIIDRNGVRPTHVSINTKFLNSLQPEWRKYTTFIRQNQKVTQVEYDNLYDSLLQLEPHIQASKTKRAARNHDPLALVAHSNAYPSQSHASPSYLAPSYLINEIITQKFSIPTNNRLRTSSNTRNQVVIQDGRVDIQIKNSGYGGNGYRNVGRQNRNQATTAGNGLDQHKEDSNQVIQCNPRNETTPVRANVQCYNCNGKGHYARDCQKPRVRDAKYFREQMLIAMKDEAVSNLNDEENDFMLDKTYGDDTLEELTAVVIMMARLQPTDDQNATEPKYDAQAVSEVNASRNNHGKMSKGVDAQMNHGKLKTIVNTSNDDQIDTSITFDGPYMENNCNTVAHDSDANDEFKDIKTLAYNVQQEAKNQKILNTELQNQKMALQQELEIYSRVKKALFTSPIAAKYKNLGATPVVAKSKFSVAKTPNSNK
ncbi:retrovirus-related pol polyprotein from transposon TNT 1-94 [Tanacetum coccineum]